MSDEDSAIFYKIIAELAQETDSRERRMSMGNRLGRSLSSLFGQDGFRVQQKEKHIDDMLYYYKELSYYREAQIQNMRRHQLEQEEFYQRENEKIRAESEENEQRLQEIEQQSQEIERQKSVEIEEIERRRLLEIEDFERRRSLEVEEIAVAQNILNRFLAANQNRRLGSEIAESESVFTEDTLSCRMANHRIDDFQDD